MNHGAGSEPTFSVFLSATQRRNLLHFPRFCYFRIAYSALAALKMGMSRSAFIVIPLIPRAPVVITWWLPWESWIPKKIPQYVLGP